MFRPLWQRLLIVGGFTIVGAGLAAQASRAWQAELGTGAAILLSAGAAGLAAALGVWVDARAAAARSAPAPDNPKKRLQESLLQADLLQLNQELQERALAQTSELATLNVELALQIARHSQAEESARASEERFRTMADNIQDGLTIIENDHLVYINDRACEIFGECPNGSLEQRIRDFAEPEQVSALLEHLSDSITAASYPFEMEYWIRRQDGERRCIREHYSTNQVDHIQRIFVVTADITERIQAYQTLEQAVSDRTHELSTVLEVSRRIASTLELEPLLNLILEQIQSIIPYSGAAIFTYEEQVLKAIASQAPGLPDQPRPLLLPLAAAGPYQQLLMNPQVMIIDDVQGEPPLALALRASMAQETSGSPPVRFAHARSWIGIPLMIRSEVTGLLSLTHNQPGFYTQRHARLAQTITNQVAIAIENARLYEKAQDLATLEERHRIARELHDSVTQLLYGITLYCTAAGRSIRSLGAQAAAPCQQVEMNLAEIKDTALQALQEMRLLILELDPPLLQEAGLQAALQASLEAIESRTSLQTSLTGNEIGRLPRTIEPELYRIAMEALNNLVRYARAQRVSVDLQSRGGWIFMEIRDNGVGFNLAQARNNGGMGLHSMEQRARKLGGRLEITSNPGSGTCIRAEVPAYDR